MNNYVDLVPLVPVPFTSYVLFLVGRCRGNRVLVYPKG